MNSIQLTNLSKRYSDQVVFEGLSLRLAQGEHLALTGPSGCGKTTLLRILIGLEKPDSGECRGIGDLRISAVFQEDRLCPQLSAVQNISIACPSVPKEDILQVLKSIGLTDFEDKQARDLSGGMRRRVALVRALLAKSDLLVMDEPFKGLDIRNRQLAIDAVTRLVGKRSFLLITHDPLEAELLKMPLVQFKDLIP